MNSILLEVCVDCLGDAMVARDAGADRIEVCASLGLGGLTPSYGLTRKTIELGIPVFAMIRPHAGGFSYDDADVSCMLADIEAFRSLGVSGFVFGALDEKSHLDGDVLEQLVKACQGQPMTLHRAFDLATEPGQALERAIELGFDRILTSGGAASVLEGMPLLQQLFEAAGDRIIIMPGGGVSPATVSEIYDGLPLKEIHASCKKVVIRESGCPTKLDLGRIDTGQQYCTDPHAVSALKVALESR